MKRALAAFALTLLAAGTASADPRDGRYTPPPLAGGPYAGTPYGADPFDDAWPNDPRGYEQRRYDDDDRDDAWALYAFRFGYDGRDWRDVDRGPGWRDGRGWEHQRVLRRGDQLTRWQLHRAEFVRDFWSWRLPPPPRGAAWLRLGDRLILVRLRDAIVLDVFRV